MSVFKCKMCGGTIEFEQGATVGICDSCGTKQTLPRLDDDRRANLYDRANHFRRNNEFDKAAGLYEHILNEDPSDAEAYWSLVLCRFGIEYVEDPATHKRVPTVNRTQYTSIFDDEDYKSALRCADGFQRGIYEEEATAINEIQKGILAISQQEKPFDVFICYKETDPNGRRTPDSVLATDLYHQLTQEGFKVFFARITLEDKLGTAYEPYIFAALNSAKVMVVLGTRPEYFNAVWVKNEWSRYLSLVKASGGKKVLIPAYRDMDPYDLPEEFSHLQAQDMSKLGFMQDLIRGIKKIIGADEPKAPVKETVVMGSAANIAPLLKRAFMFLEDGDWNRADDFCEQVLNQDPENAQAYLGKLMAEKRAHRQEDLADCPDPFDGSNNYTKAVSYGDERLSSALRGYIDHINERNENDRLTGLYNSAVSAMNAAGTEAAYKSAAEAFRRIPGFKDADALAKQCLEKAEALRKDRQAKEEAERLEAERKAEQERIAKEAAAKKRKKTIAIVTPILVTCIAFVVVLTKVIIPNGNYNKAKALLDAGQYEEAITAFTSLNGYKDSSEQIELAETGIKEREYAAALALLDAGQYKEAYKAFETLGNYRDCIQKLKETKPIALLESASISSVVCFGSYEQDNDTSNGKEDIEWQVLAKENDRLLVISKYELDCQPYNKTATDITWEKCTLRNWLNGTFLKEAFSAEEQALIPTVTVSADKNPKYSTNPGNSTSDRVFLLSIPETRQYFSSDTARKCEPTAYAQAQGCSVNNGFCCWWLRSPGGGQSIVAIVNDGGSVYYLGNYVYNDYVAVRPALWIDLGS